MELPNAGLGSSVRKVGIASVAVTEAAGVAKGVGGSAEGVNWVVLQSRPVTGGV